MDIAKTVLGASDDQYNVNNTNQKAASTQSNVSLSNTQNSLSAAQDSEKRDSVKTNDIKSVKKYSKIAEDILNAFNVELRFKVLRDPKGVIEVEVWDRSENKLIRKIPPDDVIRLIKHIQDMMGKLLDKKA